MTVTTKKKMTIEMDWKTWAEFAEKHPEAAMWLMTQGAIFKPETYSYAQ